MNKVAPWKAGSKQRERERGVERKTGRSQKYETKKERKRSRGGGAESSQEAPLKFVHNVEISVKELPLDAAPSFF